MDVHSFLMHANVSMFHVSLTPTYDMEILSYISRPEIARVERHEMKSKNLIPT